MEGQLQILLLTFRLQGQCSSLRQSWWQSGFSCAGSSSLTLWGRTWCLLSSPSTSRTSSSRRRARWVMVSPGLWGTGWGEQLVWGTPRTAWLGVKLWKWCSEIIVCRLFCCRNKCMSLSLWWLQGPETHKGQVPYPSLDNQCGKMWRRRDENKGDFRANQNAHFQVYLPFKDLKWSPEGQMLERIQ